MVQSTKNSTQLKLLVTVIMIAGFAFMLMAVYFYYLGLSTSGKAQSNYYGIMIILAVISFIVLSISSVVFQLGRQTPPAVDNMPKMMTTIECKGCGAKNMREFQRGDFVFKEMVPCQKCGNKQVISAIYKEVKEKEKTYNV